MNNAIATIGSDVWIASTWIGRVLARFFVWTLKTVRSLLIWTIRTAWKVVWTLFKWTHIWPAKMFFYAGVYIAVTVGIGAIVAGRNPGPSNLGKGCI